MAPFMRRFNAETYALLRIVAGFLFLWHGTQKVLDFPLLGREIPAHIQYGAGLIELVGGTLIMIGLFTRWSAFICSGLMAFAYWMAHGSKGFLPISNGGELAVLYCFLFLFIASQGAGIWSMDAKRGG